MQKLELQLKYQW